jgi:AbrB family looped-hinge helix DNA binding protein
MKTRVSEKGQITIPKKIRDILGIKHGTVLDVSASGGRLVAVKQERQDPLRKWRGKGRLPGSLSVDEYLERIRG